MAKDKGADQFSEAETKRRAEEALKRMLQTPHKPIGKKGASPAKPKPKKLKP